MGKKTLEKQMKQEALEAQAKARLALLTRTIRERKAQPGRPLAQELEGFEEKFIKPIDGFKLKTRSAHRDKQIIELVRYAFNKYTVPAFLYQAWTDEMLPDNPNFRAPRRAKPNKDINFKQWYLCVAQGGSLYKQHAKDWLTKKEVHLFLTQPHDLSIDQALYFAICKSAGATDGIALRIARSKMSEQPINEYWKNCARFFSQDCPPSVQALGDLVDFLAHKRREDANFSIFGAGFTVASLNKKMIDWHHELRRVKEMGSASWEGHALDNDKITITDLHGDESHWVFYQIKSTKELAAEGTAQRHCVYSYKEKCQKGYCSIWSMRKVQEFVGEKRALTIELNDDGRIVQARGIANRSPRSEEHKALAKWASKNFLHLSPYY